MYAQLHYGGDVTAAAKPGAILGYRTPDMVIWEIIDAEFDGERTTVNLQQASREALVGAGLAS